MYGKRLVKVGEKVGEKVGSVEKLRKDRHEHEHHFPNIHVLEFRGSRKVLTFSRSRVSRNRISFPFISNVFVPAFSVASSRRRSAIPLLRSLSAVVIERSGVFRDNRIPPGTLPVRRSGFFASGGVLVAVAGAVAEVVGLLGTGPTGAGAEYSRSDGVAGFVVGWEMRLVTSISSA